MSLAAAVSTTKYWDATYCSEESEGLNDYSRLGWLQAKELAMQWQITISSESESAEASGTQQKRKRCR